MNTRLALRVAARISHREGKLTNEQYKRIRHIIRHPEQIDANGNKVDVLQEIENYTLREMGSQGLIDWNAVIQWFKDHWQDILQVILKILPLFLLEEPKNET